MQSSHVYCAYTVDAGPTVMKVLEAELPKPLEPEEVAKASASIPGVLVGLDKKVSPCTLASAYIHALELRSLGVLRVKRIPLAVLILLYGGRQISDVTSRLNSVRYLYAIGVDEDLFKHAIGRLTGIEWAGVECSYKCSAGDLHGIASHVALLL